MKQEKEIDFSIIEVAVLARAEQIDPHRAVAAKLFDVNEEDVTPEMRRIGKTINFGVMYGKKYEL